MADKDDAPKSTVIQVQITPVGIALILAGAGVAYWAWDIGGLWHMLGVVGMFWLVGTLSARTMRSNLSAYFHAYSEEVEAELRKLANANKVLTKQAEELKLRLTVQQTHEQTLPSRPSGDKPE